MVDTSSQPLLQLDEVVKTYTEGVHERTVLDHVGLTLDRGDSVVLMGRSGAGKSTLLNLISGIDLPTSGRIVIDGNFPGMGPIQHLV